MTLKFGSGNRAGLHCVKIVRTRSVSGLYFPEFGLNTEIYRANLNIQSECGKKRPEKLRIWTLFTQCYTTMQKKVNESGTRDNISDALK